MQAVLDFRVDMALLKDRATALKSFLNRGWKRAGGFRRADFAVGSWSGHLRQLAAAPWILRERGSGTREIAIICCCHICRSLRWRWN